MIVLNSLLSYPEFKFRGAVTNVKELKICIGMKFQIERMLS